MKKYFLIIATFIISSLALAANTSALSGSNLALNKAYAKGNGSYDVVVKASPNEKLALYINDKNPVFATANSKGWATFHKAKISGEGKVSFTQVFGSKKVQKPINYVRFFKSNKTAVSFLASNPSAPSVKSQTPAPTTPAQGEPTPTTPTPVPTPQPTCTNGSYVNSVGNTVCSPEVAPSAPAGATAQCVDGTYSFSQTRRGTCSHHGGVASWL